MTESTAASLRQSRELEPDQHNLPQLFAVEETIARMPDDDVMELQEQLNRTATDGFLYLWLGLAAHHRQQWPAALDAFAPFFPGRQIIGLRSDAILSGGGSFHCCSQQMPSLV